MLNMNPHLSKAGQLRAMLDAGGLEFLMEAHNGISAKIVEETGFYGIWDGNLRNEIVEHMSRLMDSAAAKHFGFTSCEATKNAPC